MHEAGRAKIFAEAKTRLAGAGRAVLRKQASAGPATYRSRQNSFIDKTAVYAIILTL